MDCLSAPFFGQALSQHSIVSVFSIAFGQRSVFGVPFFAHGLPRTSRFFGVCFAWARSCARVRVFSTKPVAAGVCVCVSNIRGRTHTARAKTASSWARCGPGASVCAALQSIAVSLRAPLCTKHACRTRKWPYLAGHSQIAAVSELALTPTVSVILECPSSQLAQRRVRLQRWPT